MDKLSKAHQTFSKSVEFAKCWVQILKLKSNRTGEKINTLLAPKLS